MNKLIVKGDAKVVLDVTRQAGYQFKRGSGIKDNR